jgi:hypothetical protein
MRVFLLSMLTLVLVCAAVAQNGSQTQDSKLLPTMAQAQTELAQAQSQASGDAQKPPRPTQLYSFSPRNTQGCAFIRSYNFERNGTEAPRLKSVTTCTPVKRNAFRRTEGEPQVKLIPAN